MLATIASAQDNRLTEVRSRMVGMEIMSEEIPVRAA